MVQMRSGSTPRSSPASTVSRPLQSWTAVIAAGAATRTRSASPGPYSTGTMPRERRNSWLDSACGSHDGGAAREGELGVDHPDASGCGADQHDIVGADVEECDPRQRGEPGGRERSGHLERHVRRLVGEVGGGNDELLPQRRTGRPSHDLVAPGDGRTVPVPRLRSGCDHHTREIGADAAGERRVRGSRNEAGADLGVHGVQPGSHHADAHAGLAERRSLDLSDIEDVGAAGSVVQGSARHGGSFRSGRPRSGDVRQAARCRGRRPRR